MSANAPPPPAPEVWQAHYLRLVAFTAEPAFGIAQNWWEDVTAAAPDEFNERRPRQEREVSGLVDGIDLNLIIDPLRIQWTAQAKIDIAQPPEELPFIGQFIQRRDWFTGLMNSWLAAAPPLRRIGYVASVHQRVANHQEAYERLNQYLRCVELSPNASDFLYRINRKRASGTGIPGLEVNRLATWAASKLAVQFRALRTGAEPIDVRRGEAITCFVELDINTAPEFAGGDLPHDRLAAVIAELAQFATEIAANGDVGP